MLKRRTAVYPYLFILYIIFNPLLNNLNQVDPAQAWRPLLILLALSAAVMVLLRLITRDWHYAGYLVFLILAYIFIPGHLSRLLQDGLEGDPEGLRRTVLVTWGLLLTVLGLRRVWQGMGGAKTLTPLLNLAMTFALASQFLVSLPDIIQAEMGFAREEQESALLSTSEAIAIDCNRRPDIYYIILDGYGREDILDRLYGVDNSAFLDFLKGKGFTVADQSHSNYNQTIYSLASALNFTYIDPEPAGMSGNDYFSRLIGENRLAALLEGCGYETIALESGFYFTDHPDVDTYLASGNQLTEFENLLLAETPLETLAAKLDWAPPELSYAAHRQRVLDAFEALQRLPGAGGPRFIFAHILSPHPPFVFDAQGGEIQQRRSYSIADGNEYRGSREEYRKGYAAQMQFVNQKLEETIEAILADSSTPPVIILQGDHGPGSYVNWRSPRLSCLAERTSILNAYYLPEAAGELYPSITPVNSFRVVLKGYFGAELELLPDRTYFTSHLLPRRQIEVTQERDSWEHCGRTDSP